jgi:arylsulfatase A-like enzyme
MAIRDPFIGRRRLLKAAGYAAFAAATSGLLRNSEAQAPQPRRPNILYTAYRDCQRAVRDNRWKLIRYPLVDKTQLFDLSSDPHELNNLADKPEHAAKLAEMTALLQKEMARYGDTAPLKVANPKPAEWTPPTAGAKPQPAAKANAKRNARRNAP